MIKLVPAIVLIATLAASGLTKAAEATSTEAVQTEQEQPSTSISALTTVDQMRAQYWDLSEPEWQRYQSLMQGIRGSISPETLSPIEVLGIHARDVSERLRYAERWAHIMYEDAERILAFQRTYDAAIRRLISNQPLIDVSRLPQEAEAPSTFQSTDRILFFTRPDCPSCDLVMNQLLKRIDGISGIDIYLLDLTSGNDEAVRKWASHQQIDPEWVRNRRITLNYDGGALDKLTDGRSPVPAMFRRHGEEISRLRASEL